MPVVMSKSFGPTSTTDDTVTTIGSAYQFPAAASVTVTELIVSYGQATNANEAAGLVIVTVPGEPGSPFVYAFGNGSGGATNSNNSAAEHIRCRIPIPGNATVTVKAISAEQLTDVIVSLMCEPGYTKGSGEMTMCAGGAGQDTTADTALALTANAKVTALAVTGLTPYRNGIIRKIRFAGSGVVDAKVQSAILTVAISGYPFPLEFAVGKGSGGAATSSVADADVLNNLGIPIAANSAIVITVTSSEITLSATVSLQVD